MKRRIKSGFSNRQNNSSNEANGTPVVQNSVHPQTPIRSRQQLTRIRNENKPFSTKQKRSDRKMEPEDLRELCELIKERHCLDIVIWSLRNARMPDRYLVEIKMRKSDAILAKIETVVKTFDNLGAFSNNEEYSKFKDIKKRIELPGKRRWMKDPPWDT